MGGIMMMPCFKCPHGFVETFTECETMNRPECEECKRPGREAAERYLMRLYMEKYGVPNVVRCRECKHAQMTYDGECKYCDFWNEDGGEALYLDGDFYCAAGERKEDE